MKKFFLLMALAMAAMSLSAAPVNQATATKVAKSYLNEMYAGKIMAPAAVNPVLLKAEVVDLVRNQPVYYIFNTSTTFLVIAGDDRAEPVLMVGDQPLKDINNLAPGLQDVLSNYKAEIQYLHDHQALVVDPRPQKNTSLNATTYGPLLTATWDQETPYNNLCKFTYNNRTYTCLTGCPATSASMVLYYWKYPLSVSALASYTSTLDISSSSSVNFTYPALEATTFDWANMKDSYSSYNTAQATAVATLMRYVGQAEQMMYGTSSAGGSGIYTTNASIIATMFKNWGYASTTRRVYKSSYSSTWNDMIIAEMAAGRPTVYMAVSSSAGGHAFNVDGYRESDSKFHVNFGWSGDGNSWYSMNSFTYSGYTFNSDQQAIIGIEPAEQVPTPVLTVSPTSLTFTGNTGNTYTQTFTVSGTDLQGNVTISVGGSSYYSVSPTTLTAAQAAAGATVTVTYKPTISGTHTGTVTIASTGATSKTVSLSGTSTTVPSITVDPTSLSFSTSVDAPVTQTFVVSGSNLTDNVSVSVTGDEDDAFSVDKVSILKSAVANGVTVTVTYNPAEVGTHSASVVLASSGAESKTVTLTGTATEPERTITVSPTSLTFESAVGQAVTQTFFLQGTNLNAKVSLALSGTGSSAFSLSSTSLTYTRVNNGLDITVTYNPTTVGTHRATVTISGGGASSSQTVTLVGTAAGPTITANPTSLTFAANTGETVTNTFTVTGANLTGNLTLALNDDNGVYSITPTTITAANAANGVPVTVTYAPTAFGTHNATVTISGDGADNVTVSLNGAATLAKFTPVMMAAVEDYINLTKFRADWTDATPAANVASYTLEVSTYVEPDPEPVLLHTLDGTAYTGSYADITLSAPWGGVSVRGGNGAIYVKNNYNNVATGTLTYTIPEGYTNATFTFKVTTGSGNYGAGNITVYTPQTAAVGHAFTGGETYSWVVTASSGEQITLYSTDTSYSPDIARIEVYSGNATVATLKANETGDATYRLITGITDKFYTVENLTAAGTFEYKVKAIYQDGTESDWSNIERVTLFQNGHGYEIGDVDHNGEVGISDVTALIDYILVGESAPACTICADVDQNGTVDISDVAALIDMILVGNTASLMMPPMLTGK